METLSEYMLRRFCSAYPTVPITLSKVKAYLDTIDDWRELDDSHLALLYNFNLKNRKGIIMRNSNFNLIKSLGYIVVLASLTPCSVLTSIGRTRTTVFCTVTSEIARKSTNF